MTTTPFDPAADLAPLPFETEHLDAAKHLKACGLPWTPHVGCFVWDENTFIKVASPFPNRIYFILSMARFLNIFNTIENMQNHLVWLPTWHQARLLCAHLEIDNHKISDIFAESRAASAGGDLLFLYNLLAEALKQKKF